MLHLHLCVLRNALQKVKIHGHISLWLHYHHDLLVFLPNYFPVKAGASHLTSLSPLSSKMRVRQDQPQDCPDLVCI